MSPVEFDRRMEHVIELPSRQLVADAGFALVQEALGMNAHSYLPGLDKLCRRLRQLKPRKVFGPPHKASVGKPLVDEGETL